MQYATIIIKYGGGGGEDINHPCLTKIRGTSHPEHKQNKKSLGEEPNMLIQPQHGMIMREHGTISS